MRQRKTLKRGRSVTIRVVPILLAGGIGYLIGGLHTSALRSTDLSAADSVALRFPDAWNNAAAAAKAAPRWAMMSASAANVAGDAQLALLSPEPMIPQSITQTVPQTNSQANPPVTSDAAPTTDSQTPVQLAALETVGSSPMMDLSAPVQAIAQTPRIAPSVLAQPVRPKTAAAPTTPAPHPHVVNRPGYMLDDAQIASIKERLHLTPDQEQMWPAVEAALRNMTYTQVQEARAVRGGSSNTQVAAVDPDAVQGLKSAAVPLIMSFNADQKEEVRSIVHVMGLDQLASQF
jgi:hypothetical protein